MAAAVSASVDATNKRIGVTLSGFSASGSITVNRIHSDTGAQYPVRTVPNVSGGSGFAWDYEAPFGVAVSYTATDTGGAVTSGAVTLAVTEFWMRAPGMPDNDVKVEVQSKPTQTRDRKQGVLQPLGRSSAVVLTSSRNLAAFDLDLRTYSEAEATKLVNLLEQSATVLLLMPGDREPWRYVAVGQVIETPVVPWIKAVEGDVGTHSSWKLSCTVVDPPVGGMYGDSTDSYSTVKTNHPTYADVVSSRATYLQLLESA